MRRERAATFKLPPIRFWQLRLFSHYVRYYLRRHFHGLHLLKPPTIPERLPVLICLNHPGWWDPLIAIHLSQKWFAGRAQYAPIAAVGLEKYKMFERFGLFGIEPNSRAGAVRFLQIGQAVFQRPDGVLWVTAQGHFTDVRTRPVVLEAGVGYLAHRTTTPFVLLPLALEYAFWEERTPEAFVHFGKTQVISNGAEQDAEFWTMEFARALEHAQDELSAAVMQRNQELFTPLLSGGKSGVGGIYDVWRAGKSWLRGKRFRPEHGRGIE